MRLLPAFLLAAALLAALVVWVVTTKAPERSVAERRPDPATQPQTEPSETTSRADVSEAPQAWELHVSVREPGGKPYPGALVRFLDGLGSEIARADTSADGEARIHARGSGRAVVTRVQPYLPARSDLLETPPSGERRIVLTVAGGTLAVAGRIFDADGRAPVDVPVWAKLAAPPEWVGEWRWAGNPVRNPGEKGTFRIEGLTPGRYLLVMRLSHHAQTEGRPPATPIEVEAGDENVLIRLEAVTWLTFRWIDAVTGKPVATRRQVFQKRGDEEVPLATASGPDGLPSTRDFRPGSRLVFQARAEGYHPSEPIELALDPIERHREIVFRLRPDSDAMAELELVLRDSRGDPVRDIAIMRVFKDSAGGTVHRTEDGRVVLSLPTGTNKLRFGPLLPDRRRLDRPWIVREVVFRLQRGERRAEKVVIQRGGWLRRPRWDGRPIAARILRDGTEVEEEFIYIGRDDRRACLPPGRYQVEAELGAVRLRGEVEIEADKTHQVMLTQQE